MNLFDLPDEILLLILNKLNVVETLDQQIGVHSRLDRILFDRIYVSELDWTGKCWDGSISSMDDPVIDRVCENVLPRINEKITKLILVQNSIERVLHAVHYSSQIDLLSEQITHLDIHIIDDQGDKQ